MRDHINHEAQKIYDRYMLAALGGGCDQKQAESIARQRFLQDTAQISEATWTSEFNQLRRKNMTTPRPSMTFNYTIPGSIELSMPLLRKTLRGVQGQLLAREINGGGKKLAMDATTESKTCGMAACIGGWTSLFLLGFDKTRDNKLEGPADYLFSALVDLDRAHGSGLLHPLFYEYPQTRNYDVPNVAATAIKRYLAGRDPWPYGEMPNILPYTKRASRKHK